MRIILASRNKVYYESSSRGEAFVLYVPKAVDVRTFRDLKGKSSKEIAERYGASQQKPLIREEKGEVKIFGTLPSELVQRRHALKTYLPEDFAPKGTYAFYYLFGEKFILHGLRTVNDEGESHWGSSVITLQGGDPVKIVTSAISERMLDGDAAGIQVAVDSNLAVYEELKKSLAQFDVQVVLFSALEPKKKTLPVYQHKDRSIPMVLLLFLFILGCVGSLMYWFVNQEKVNRLDEKIKQIQVEIQNIQRDDRLGHILQPQTLLEKMDKFIERNPSSFMNAGAQLVSQFGEIDSIEVDLKNALPVSNFDTLQTIKPVIMNARVTQQTEMLLVDQERLAKQLIEKNLWLHQIDNISASSSDLSFQLYLGVEENKQ